MTSISNAHGQADRLAVSWPALRHAVAEHPRLVMWLALLAGLIVRLAIAPLGAHAGDYATFTHWASDMASHSLLDVYKFSGANYPPVALVLLNGSRLLFLLFSPGPLAGRLWLVCLKIPPILCDLGMGWLLWRAAIRQGSPLWLPLSILFNPALIYLSAWWGQLDSIYMIFALAALLAVGEKRFTLAGLLLGLGLMVKFQSAMFVPVLALAAVWDAGSWQSAAVRLAKLAGGGIIPLVVFLGPYALDGQGPAVAARLTTLISGANWPTVNALNGWYVLTLSAGNWVFRKPLTMPDNAPALFGVSYHNWGLILLTVWMAVILWLGFSRRRDGKLSHHEALLWTGMMTNLGFFLLPTEIHERYAFGVVILTCTLAIYGWRTSEHRAEWLWAYGLITVLHLLNLVWAGPFSFALYTWFSGVFGWGMATALGTIGLAGWLLAPPRDQPSA